MRQAEKGKKQFQTRIPFTFDQGKKIPEKNRNKNQNIKKPLSGIIFNQNGMRQAEKEKKEVLVPNSVHTRPGEENSEKKQQKNSKN